MTGVFNGPLLTEAVGVVSEVVIDRVTMPFSFTWPNEYSRLLSNRSTVAGGFVTDYASIPTVAQRLAGLRPKDPDYDQPAVLHDMLCQRREIDIIDNYTGAVIQTRKISRKEVDDIFLMAMEARGCPAWKRNILYAAVRTYAVLTFK